MYAGQPASQKCVDHQYTTLAIENIRCATCNYDANYIILKVNFLKEDCASKCYFVHVELPLLYRHCV